MSSTRFSSHFFRRFRTRVISQSEARRGTALLQGLVLCGRCGRRMSVYYCPQGKVKYQCIPHEVKKSVCWTVVGNPIDNAVSQIFLETVTPPEVELSMAVAHEAERQSEAVARQWRLRLERAQYEAHLAERRYKAVDPDNRVVARTLSSFSFSLS